MFTAYVVKLWFLIAGNVFKEMMFVVSQQLQELLKSVLPELQSMSSHIASKHHSSSKINLASPELIASANSKNGRTTLISLVTTALFIKHETSIVLGFFRSPS
jgi:hypothetical protein